jgi:tetratricopeptide (TPR) repeat protein
VIPPGATAEETVAAKVTQFGANRHAVMLALAERAKVEVKPEVERFFEAVAGGCWEEIQNTYQELDRRRQAGSDGEDLRPLWGAIHETFGVAEVAHLWPAQQLLDYGEAVLGSLRPGMVYVGGTDAGRFIPTLLNETGTGERHVVLTQNALADNTYREYADFLYGDRLAGVTPEESQKAFQDYIADAQKRVLHDQQLPNEAKQLRPGEQVDLSQDGGITVSGQVAVMAINERLLNATLDKNPDLSFALEESFPFSSTYGHAVPLGPITELRANDEAKPLSPERAAQALQYWQCTVGRMTQDLPPGAESEALKAYSHLAAAQANLLAAQNYPAEAEQTLRLALQLCPGNAEGVYRLSELLARSGRGDEARQTLERFNASTRPAPPRAGE